MKLVRAYQLISCEVHWSDGRVTRPFGNNPERLLIYTSTEYTSGRLMRPGVPAFSSGGRVGTAEEPEAAFRGYLGYFGTYTLEEAAGRTTHHVVASRLPNWVGTEQVRYFRKDGDTTLIDAAAEEAGDRTRRSRLVWRRAEDRCPGSSF